MDKKSIIVNKNIKYEELSELLQQYFDNGNTLDAMEYCEELARIGNPYGYLFMGFVYEEGSGPVLVNPKKALYCYQIAENLGIDTKQDILRIQNLLKSTDT